MGTLCESRKRFFLLGAVLAAALASALLAQMSEKEKRPLEKRLYELYEQQGFQSLEDGVRHFQTLQRDGVLLMPPGEPYVRVNAGLKYFKPAGFPREFLNGLAAEEHSGYVTYPVTVFEESGPRQYVFVNARGEAFYAVPVAADTDPDWVLLSYCPDYFSEGHSPEELDAARRQFNSLRVIARYDLIERADLLVHIRQLPVLEDPPMGMMKAYSGAPVTAIQFTSMERVGTGVVATLAYPNGFTNDLDIFSCPDLLDNAGYPFWDLEDTISVSGTNWVEWLDADGATNGPVTRKYYAAGNAGLNATTDPDGDGLSWAREVFMYHTCPTNSDSDGDGLSDDEEVINLKTDPNNSDTNKPTAAFSFPTNNYRWVWMP